MAIVAIIGGMLAGFASALGVWLARRYLRARRDGAPRYYTRYAFSGNLKQTNLLDAVQFLELGRREGVLHIYSGRRKGYLSFLRGRMIDAFYRDRTGKEAIFGMLELEEGDFYFEPKPITHPPLLTDSIVDIAFEWDSRSGARGPREQLTTRGEPS
ncbi:MAG: DUF4388 domain-containing protein [Chitinivibrionales bacterium]|nr:DUF4388 domain-containing protein [Chitinivibrionales bacterium]